jgi:hypothetical protein
VNPQAAKRGIKDNTEVFFSFKRPGSICKPIPLFHEGAAATHAAVTNHEQLQHLGNEPEWIVTVHLLPIGVVVTNSLHEPSGLLALFSYTSLLALFARRRVARLAQLSSAQLSSAQLSSAQLS